MRTKSRTEFEPNDKSGEGARRLFVVSPRKKLGIGLQTMVLVITVAGTCQNLCQAKNAKQQLEGRVEDSDKIRLERPNSNVINQSVEILDGQAYGGSLDGRADDTNLQSSTAEDTLKGLVGAGDFKLGSYKPRTPQTDPGNLRDWQSDMESQRWQWKSVNYAVPRYCIPCDDVPQDLPRYKIPRRYFELDDWKLREREVHGQVNFPQADAQLLPSEQYKLPSYKLPNYQLPRSFAGFNQEDQDSTNFKIADEERFIAWDTWYKKVADTLWRTWRARGSEPGEADVALTVSNSKGITAEVLNVTNRSTAFTNSLLNAVQALNGSPTLTFPAQSKRRSVSFQSHFSAGVNVQSGASSKRNNDTERVRVRSK